MAETYPKLTSLQKRILEALQAHPEGLDIHQIGRIATPGNFQQELNRRVRDLYPYYEIERRKQGKRTIYVLKGQKGEVAHDDSAVGQQQRARILNRDKGRCQMCGRTVADDAVKLHVDHKIPRAWGGDSTDSNLWALCTECNLGKKDYFSSFDSAEMASVLESQSVHARIANLLKLREGQWVDPELIEFVAGIDTFQQDWPKRTRELRYFGIEFRTQRVWRGRRAVNRYMLTKWAELPEDPTKEARKYERMRARRNRHGAEEG